jgi:hypothetical protein
MSDGHWQLEGNAAELYQRYLVPAITAKWAQDLVDRALLGAGEEPLVAGFPFCVGRRTPSREASGSKPQ